MNRLTKYRILLIAAFIAGMTLSSPAAGNEMNTLSAGTSWPQLFRNGEPKAAKKARKKQEAKKKQQKKDYADFVKANQKRSVEIQTPEVQERMKQNLKDADSKYKNKKKVNTSRTKKAGKKYNS